MYMPNTAYAAKPYVFCIPPVNPMDAVSCNRLCSLMSSSVRAKKASVAAIAWATRICIAGTWSLQAQAYIHTVVDMLCDWGIAYVCWFLHNSFSQQKLCVLVGLWIKVINPCIVFVCKFSTCVLYLLKLGQMLCWCMCMQDVYHSPIMTHVFHITHLSPHETTGTAIKTRCWISITILCELIYRVSTTALYILVNPRTNLCNSVMLLRHKYNSLDNCLLPQVTTC